MDESFKNVLDWLPVSDSAWDVAARLWADCRRRGRPHEDDGDLLIAAQAGALDAVVVTRNARDFADLHVTVENWESG